MQHPCVSLTLPPVSLCLRDACLEQRAHPGSSLYHWSWRLISVRRMSYSILHKSLQLVFLFSTLSHCVHCPCFVRKTFLAHLGSPRISSTFNFRCSGVFAEFQEGCLGVTPFSCWTIPTMSACLRADIMFESKRNWRQPTGVCGALNQRRWQGRGRQHEVPFTPSLRFGSGAKSH